MRRLGVLRSVGGLWLGFVTSQLLGFLGTVWTARHLGPEVFGRAAVAQALAAYAILFASAGTDVWGMREAARREGRGLSIGDVLGVRLVAGLAGVVVVLAIAWAEPTLASDLWLTALYASAAIPIALRMEWWLLGRGRGGSVGLGNGIRGIATLAVVVLAIRGPKDLAWAPVAFVVGFVVASAISFGLSRGTTDQWGWRPSLGRSLQIVREAAPLAVALVAAQVYYNVDVILLRVWRGATEAGLYASAYRIVLLVVGLRHLVVQGVFPSLVKGVDRGPERLTAVTEAAQRLGAAIGLPIAVLGLLFGSEMLLTVFGRDYAAAGPAFVILVVMAGLVFVDLTWPQLLNALDRSRAYMSAIMLGAVVNIALNIALIPRYGMIGAAWASFGAEFAIMVAAVAGCRDVVWVAPARYLGRPVLAALVMGLVGAATRGLGWPVAGALALTAYGMVAWLVGAVRPRDLVHFEDAEVVGRSRP
jgi:O-antigen/teichoic acid export membrane protein